MALTIDEEIVRRGLIANPAIIYPSDKLITTLTELGQNRIASTDYPIHPLKLDDVINYTQQFLKYYYKLRSIPQLTIKKILGHQIHIVKESDPLNLPINLIDTDDAFAGSVTEIFTERTPHIVFREINLAKVITEQTGPSYAHEITHTQLDSLKGSLKEFYNLEVLSIFNELFLASVLDKEERVLRLNDSRRIHEMHLTAEELREHQTGKIPMDKVELLDSCKYLISGLKAYNLFIQFYYANEAQQNEMLDDIQSIFDGYLTVEELLYKYEITHESIQETKRLFKYFNR